MKDFSDELFVSGYESVDKSKGSTKSTGTSMTTTTTKPCYETHPVLKIGNGTFIGGSCSWPMADDADVYVGLEHSMYSHNQWPWLPKTKKKVVDVSYPITDYAAPKDSKSFKDMVNWLCNQLQRGKTVHVGCIGGHGRTGTVLSAVVAEMEQRKVMDLGKYAGNAIGWVRKNYCKKAVESEAQIKFLHKNFGCKTVEAAKTMTYTGNYGSGYGMGSSVSGTRVDSVASNRCIWEIFKPGKEKSVA